MKTIKQIKNLYKGKQNEAPCFVYSQTLQKRKQLNVKIELMQKKKNNEIKQNLHKY